MAWFSLTGRILRTPRIVKNAPLASKLAELALVGAIPGVGENVLLQTLLVGVGGVAEGAGVGFVSSVRAAVSGDRRLGVSAVQYWGFSLEFLLVLEIHNKRHEILSNTNKYVLFDNIPEAADITDEGPLVCVLDADMLVEGGLLHRGVGAFGAFEPHGGFRGVVS